VRSATLAIAALLIAVSLGGCSLVGSSAKPKATSTPPSALSALFPTYPDPLTEATAKSGTVRAANAIQALLEKAEIVHVDDQSKQVAATSTTGAFYGVERAITTTSGFDVMSQATAMEKLLVQAGWIERATNTSTTAYTVQLTAATSVGPSALFLEADASVTASPVILIEIESPDLPK
jgi:hypothetical protein